MCNVKVKTIWIKVLTTGNPKAPSLAVYSWKMFSFNSFQPSTTDMTSATKQTRVTVKQCLKEFAA